MRTDNHPWQRDLPQTQRQRVLDVAGDLFADRGFDDVTMAEIAAAAEVGAGDRVQLLRLEAQLVEALTETVLEVFREMLDEALADEITADSRPRFATFSSRWASASSRSGASSAGSSARSRVSSSASTRASSPSRPTTTCRGEAESSS